MAFRRRPSARRRPRRTGRNYFSIPRGGFGNFGGFRQLGENTRIHQATAMFVVIFIGLIVWTQAFMPGLNAVECGLIYGQEYRVWLETDDKGQEFALALREWQAAGEVNSPHYNPIPQDPPRLASYVDADFPACDDGIIPRGRTHHQVYQLMLQFLPLFALVAILFLVFRQMGNIATLPAFVTVLFIRAIVPGDGIIDYAVLVFGIAVACIPIPMGGLVASLMHMAALALWPTVILAYTETAIAVSDIISPSVLLISEITVWVIPFGLLVLMPIRWKMTNDEMVNV